MKPIDKTLHIGNIFGGLKVISFSHRINGKNYYICSCDCGKNCTSSINSLRVYKKHCGCKGRSYWRKHGETYTAKEYKIWVQMRSRCERPNDKLYPYYGGRGIKVCERWAEYKNFIADIGRRPSPQHSLDRINNNGDYEPGNIRWATKKEQANNRRSNFMVTHNGETLSLSLFSEKYGIKYWTLYKRIKRGDPIFVDGRTKKPIPH